MLASALVVGLAIGVVVTVFGYSNLTSVNVRWSIFQVEGVPLWTVAIIPLAVVLVAGTVYHWMDGLHHFSEHMRHRHRVHELEAEVATLRSHLDQVLDMPDHSTSRLSPKAVTAETPAPHTEVPTPALHEPAVEVETAPSNGAKKVHQRAKRATLKVIAQPAPQLPSPLTTNGGQETAAPESAPEI
jgi:hypothetical protein